MLKKLGRLILLSAVVIGIINYQAPIEEYLGRVLAGKTEMGLTQAVTQVPPISVDTSVKRQFTWQVGRRDWSWSISLSQTGYEYFKHLPRIPTDDYSLYVTNPADDVYLNGLVKEFRNAQTNAKLNEYQMIELVVAFVQSIPYVEDKVSTGQEEYPKYPIETLYEQSGDCEDKSILMASLLDRLGYGVVLLAMPNHMAVGVKGASSIPGTFVTYQGNRYYYLETTSVDWQIGDIPSEMEKSKAKILPLVPKPVLTHRWEGKGNLLNYRVAVTVNNQGTGSAINTKVQASFDASSNKVYSQSTSTALTIPPGGQATFNITLRYPHRVKTRVHVKVISNGTFDSESTSEWFNTK